mmetsp:Transcript_23389/g.49811  ORF Transcript_23389/g.49811 Transcript_23389/m.49811 type:complete len:216 (-) Transcript_23389:13-660(-)
MWAQLMQMDVRRHGAPGVRHQHPDEGQRASSIIGIPIMSLAGGEIQGHTALIAAQDAAHGVHLHGIRHEQGIAVALHPVDVKCRDDRSSQRVYHKLLLGSGARCAYSGTPAVVIHLGACDRAEEGLIFNLHPFAIDHLFARLQDTESDAVAHHVAVRAGVEGETTAQDREQPCRLELGLPIGGDIQVDATGEREVVEDATPERVHTVRPSMHSAE